MRNARALAVAAVASAGIAWAPTASAATAPVSDVTTVAAFDWSAGQAPENITINPDESMTITMLGSPAGQPPQLVRVTPSGVTTVLVVGETSDIFFAGNTRGPDGTVYYLVDSTDASRSGVWRISPGGTPERIAAFPADQLLNGLAIDPTGQTLYIADSFASTVWSVPAAGGTATAWLDDPALAPAASGQLGANGLRFHNGAVWVSNTSQGTLMRVPVTASGAPGTLQTVSTTVPGIDDFNFPTDRSDIVFAALNAPNEVAIVSPTGQSSIVLTAADGLESPSATAICGPWLYITDGAIHETPHNPALLRAHIDLSSLGD